MPRTRVCGVGSCKSTSENSSISFFKLPRDERRQEWLTRLGHFKSNCEWKVICSNHFGIDSFTDTFRRRLHKTAVPLSTSEQIERNLNNTFSDSFIVKQEESLIEIESTQTYNVQVKEPGNSDSDGPFCYNSQTQTVSPCNKSKDFYSSTIKEEEPLNKIQNSQRDNIQIKVEPDDSNDGQPFDSKLESQLVSHDAKSKDSKLWINSTKEPLNIIQSGLRNSIKQKMEMSGLNNEYSKKKTSISVSKPQISRVSDSSSRNRKAEPLSEMNGKHPRPSSEVVPTKRCVVAELVVYPTAKSKQKGHLLNRDFYC